MIKKRFFKTKDEVEVTFEWPQSDESSVSLAGDFNEWQAEPMKLNKKSKVFSHKMRLPKDDSFQFRYLINESVWENDPVADEYIGNDFGSNNSLLHTKEA